MTKTFYICGSAWVHELGVTGVIAYPSLEVLENERGCTVECGVIAVSVTEENLVWVKEPQAPENRNH
jgi:hypothetical protein